ncbi:uncharacterized protein LOC124303837 isoform X1 [Neodiprion virginianus]|uniref:uncharacterized protein LOC124303837 isoform X1 n=1 Tax=Neodiprion virginianus TaxID=2961670 RepID=UPI001EE748AA|nr:uncharacterized protein LOC124303837 isoform X1 [Neodiprion virginianus]XP_046617520.1 uncharacterized protein LOC124303837 isoform X1 [Neodiprion virginianus]
MSGQMKVKSLSLSRRTQTPPAKEEGGKLVITETEKAQVSNLDSMLSSPISHSSHLCSTPIRNNVERRLRDESPDQYLHYSPTSSLYPCTQESGSEIAWDWHSTSNGHYNSSSTDTAGGKGNTMNNNTPKRTQLLSKQKRTAKSNSPLLNIPPKRKLMLMNVAESIGKFAAELKAVADNIKMEQQSTESREAGSVAASEASKEVNIFDMKTQVVRREDDVDIHEASTFDFNILVEKSPGCNNDAKTCGSSLDDMFDESLDECMVQCSQEVEDKLKQISEVSKKMDKPATVTCASNSGRPNTDLNAKRSLVNAASRQHNFETRDGVNTKTVKRCDVTMLGNDIPASQIPDDSFDDCLALCLDDDDELLSQYVNNTKVKISNNSTNANSAKMNTTDSSSKTVVSNKWITTNLDKANPRLTTSGTNQPMETSSNFKRKQQCMMSSEGGITLQSRKFFKTKSLSDSICENTSVGTDSPSKTAVSITLTTRNLDEANPMPTTSWTNQPMETSSNFKRKQQCMTGSESATAYENRKFFKSKSLSDSNCGNASADMAGNSKSNLNPNMGGICNVQPVSKSSSNHNLNACSTPNVNNPGSADSQVSYSYRRYSNNINGVSNGSVGNSDPYAVPTLPPDRQGFTGSRNAAVSNCRLAHCTPEEIERKRTEARMKLESRLRKQGVTGKPDIGPVGKRPAVKR